MYNGIIIANSNSGCRIGMSVTGVASYVSRGMTWFPVKTCVEVWALRLGMIFLTVEADVTAVTPVVPTNFGVVITAYRGWSAGTRGFPVLSRDLLPRSNGAL